MSGERLLGPQGMVVGVSDVLRRRGFERRPAFLEAVASEDRSDRIAASWIRVRAAPQASWEGTASTGLDADWASVWNEHIHLRVGGVSLDLHWGRTPLDADELGHAIEQFVTAVDRFAPAE